MRTSKYPQSHLKLTKVEAALDEPAPNPSTYLLNLSRFFKNYFSTLFFISLGLFFIRNNGFYRGFLTATYSFDFASGVQLTSQNIFNGIAIAYAVLLVPYYWIYSARASKARLVLRTLYQSFVLRMKISQDEKQRAQNAARTWAVKWFFAPLMIKWFFDNFFATVNGGFTLFHTSSVFSGLAIFLEAFNAHGFWFLLNLILFVDVLFFTLGYLVEIPALKNEIVSAEPSLLGWVVCLVCYPPFDRTRSAFIAWQSNDFPHFSNPYIHLTANSMILLLMGFYAMASIALNFKASNLTNRGIISKGLYSLVRHPAYIAKNTAWWIGGIPNIVNAVTEGSFSNLVMVLFSLCAITGIYYLRAITEEQHLLKGQNGYKEYCQKVKYRFIPGLY